MTVGMMTTGYDCPDILNLGLFRPIFSPTDFIQIKGRGTRNHNFLEQLFDDSIKAGVAQPQKTAFKFFDFFANCEYFEEAFNYDEVRKLPWDSFETNYTHGKYQFAFLTHIRGHIELPPIPRTPG